MKLMSTNPPILALRELAASSARLMEPVTLDLPKSVPHSNLADTNATFARHMNGFVYRDRVAQSDGIDLIGLPMNTVVYGSGHFVTAVGDTFIEEQFPPYIGTFVPNLSTITEVPRTIEQVSGDKLLVGRFGVSTWGHWIGELLPKVLLAERLFPKRFQYVMPSYVRTISGSPSIWTSIRESLSTVGIDLARILYLDEDRNYSFESLYAITSLWSDFMIHPAASDALREGVSHIHPAGQSKLAVVRDHHFQRMIANADEVYSMLADRGFHIEKTGLLPFTEQVSRFKAADIVFGVLGSDLTNIVFSPQKMKLISVAPDVFGDRFFYALVLDRSGQMADMRGPIVKREDIEHKSVFKMEMSALEAVIDEMVA